MKSVLKVHGLQLTEMWKRLQKHQTQLLLCLLGFSFGITIRIHRNYLVEKCNYEESLHPRSGSFADMVPVEEPSSGNRKLVNIGVMSAQKFLMRRTRDIAESWAIDVSDSESGGKVTVFSDNPEKIKFDHLNIVTLQGVNDNMYPPQRKSYSVIRHFHDLELNNFDWFMRLDDDVYLNFPRVESFLKKLDPTKPLMIGNAGMGRDPDDYVPKEMTYCMGGTGIIFSREAIKQIRPHLHKCLKEEIYSEHEDIELGRCFFTHLNLTCTNARDTPDFFWNNYRPRPLKPGQSSSWDNIDMKKVSDKVKEKAMTLHSNKFYPYQQNSRLDMLRYEAQIIQDRINDLQNKMLRVVLHTEPQSLEQTDDIFETYRKDDDGKVYHYKLDQDNPVQVNRGAAVDRFASLLGYEKSWKSLSYGRSKNSYIYAMQVENEEGIRDTAIIKKTLGGMETKTVERFEKNCQAIDFIIPLVGREDQVDRFLKNIRDDFSTSSYSINLIFVYFKEEQHVDEIARLRGKLKHMKKFSSVEFTCPVDFDVITSKNDFSRGIGLQMGADSRPMDSILFMVDIDMAFKPKLLQNIISNTKVGQAYMPIIFSQFKKRPEPDAVTDRHGFWRNFGYGMVSIYRSDLVKSGGYDKSIIGWGLEDVKLAERLIEKDVNIFRAVEPNLLHIYHDKDCSGLEDQQKKACVDVMNNHYTSSEALYEIFLKKSLLRKKKSAA